MSICRQLQQFSLSSKMIKKYNYNYNYNSNSNSNSNNYMNAKRKFHLGMHAESQPHCPAKFLGATSVFTETKKFTNFDPVNPEHAIPCYRVMDVTGSIVDGCEEVPKLLSDEAKVHIYKSMVTQKIMDNVLYDAQRQGRISFYMTSYGEEATHFGTASALDNEDMVWAQYREVGVLTYRGFTLENVMAQVFSTEKDGGKGRQMPVHYGSKKFSYQTISSPLTTQLPQAVGGAYAFKVANKSNVTACYFGEGAASEGDFHAALNFASTLDAPVLFICRNNGYAISTPVKDQYRGDGIAGRGPGYGIDTLRVDGNDIFAVHDATKFARAHALKNSRPVLIEAMTYRGGHHSTSDDSTRYRKQEEINLWVDENGPIIRLKAYLLNNKLWDADKEAEHISSARKTILSQLKIAETNLKPAIKELFTDVYDKKTKSLLKQEKELLEHLEKYKEHYDLAKFAASK